MMLSETEDLMFETFRTPMTYKEASVKLGMNYYTVATFCRQLALKKMLKKVGAIRDKSQVWVSTDIGNVDFVDGMVYLYGSDGSRQPITNYFKYWLAPPDQRTTKSQAAIVDFYEVVVDIIERRYTLASIPDHVFNPVERITLRRRLVAAKNQLDSTSDMIKQLLETSDLWMDKLPNEYEDLLVEHPMFPSLTDIQIAMKAVRDRRSALKTTAGRMTLSPEMATNEEGE